MGRVSRRRTLTGALALALALAACGGAGDGDNGEDTGDGDAVEGSEAGDAESGTGEVSLTYASYGPETVAVSVAMMDWFEKVDEAADADVESEAFWSESLLEATEVMPGVASGRADAGLMATVYHPAEFPLSALSEVPFVTDDIEAVAWATMDLYENYEPYREEWHSNGLHLLGIGVFPTNALVSREPVASIDDLEGARIRSCGFLSEALSAVGANPVDITQPEVYESLERGVIDMAGCVTSNLARDFSYDEVAPYLVDTGTGLFAQTYQVMSLDTWESLPADVQQAFEDTHEDYMETVLTQVMEDEEDACDVFREAGGEFTQLPESDISEWEDAVGDELLDVWRERAEGAGADADAYLDAYLDAVDRHAGSGIYEPGFDRCE
jgi:TRAP-type transport system periplasmic protein